jgi:hypothetical protein
MADKMHTISKLRVGTYDWPNSTDQARIERNSFLFCGEVFEGLRFCKFRNGRHTRVHLVISEGEWVELFRDAVQNGVFSTETIEEMRRIIS